MGQVRPFELTCGLAPRPVRMLEIPRRRHAHIWWLGAGTGVLGAAASLLTEATATPAERAVLGALFVTLATILIRSHNRVLRTPRLRATCEGLWFGGGSIVPWHEVVGMGSSGPTQHDGGSTPRRQIRIAFRHRRTMLRVPCTLWLSSRARPRAVWPPGAERLLRTTVAISLEATALDPSTVFAQLSALRLAACSDENGVLPGASEVPAARVVVRS